MTLGGIILSIYQRIIRGDVIVFHHFDMLYFSRSVEQFKNIKLNVIYQALYRYIKQFWSLEPCLFRLMIGIPIISKFWNTADGVGCRQSLPTPYAEDDIWFYAPYPCAHLRGDGHCWK